MNKKLFSFSNSILKKINSNLSAFDGNKCAAHVAFNLSEIASLYPITPSSTMGEYFEEFCDENKKNIFGSVPIVRELQSEAGASGVLHGALSVGALATTFTSSQGLLLMIPTMCKISGELMPAVFHVAARAVSYQSLSIYGDHEDVALTRSTGFVHLASSSVQEIMDLGTIAHIATLRSSVPFLHFFDGWVLSHSVQSIYPLEKEDFMKLYDFEALKKFRDRGNSPLNPLIYGHGEGPDVCFQHNEAANQYYDNVPKIVEQTMEEFSKKIGRKYELFEYSGALDAENLIVIMGAGAKVVELAVEYYNKKFNKKFGMINCHLVRPFSADHFLKKIPKSCKKICVLDRTKEYAGTCEPLFGDVQFVLAQRKMNEIQVIGGRFGLSSKDLNLDDAFSVFENLEKKNSKNNFTVGIIDDVTHKNIEKSSIKFPKDSNVYESIFLGLGGDGAVSSVKSVIQLAITNNQSYGQSLFSYSADKSYSETKSFLRLSKDPIKQQFQIKQNADFVSCNKVDFLKNQRVVEYLKNEGNLLLNTDFTEEELEKNIPNKVKKIIAERNINLYLINCAIIDQECQLSQQIAKPLQAAFFKISGVLGNEENYLKLMEDDYVKKYKFINKNVVENNLKSIRMASSLTKKYEYPKDKWLSAATEDLRKKTGDKFIDEVFMKCFYGEGGELPVSKFKPGGGYQLGTSKYDKKGYSHFSSFWARPKDCIQCNNCSAICPRNCIRPIILTDEEIKNAPLECEYLGLIGKPKHKEKKFRIQVSPYDCTGCSLCVQICPKKCLDIKRSSETKPIDGVLSDYFYGLKTKEDIFESTTVKGSQFKNSHFAFSASCSGCGESNTIRLVTQQFGSRMTIASASGCNSVYSAVFPRTPFFKNSENRGPAWLRSLFEDAAEIGMGNFLGDEFRRNSLKNLCETLINDYEKNENQLMNKIPQDFVENLKEWTKNYLNVDKCEELYKKINSVLIKLDDKLHKSIPEIKQHKNEFIKISHWIIGGDGWAYDIGYSGLDHVISNKKNNLNVLVLDTEVYSNTGGQCSKASPYGSSVKYAASGKETSKKNLAMRGILYDHVFVSTITLGSQEHVRLAIENVLAAEKYNGPSMILAYCNCVEHKIRNPYLLNENLAVTSGYWPLISWNPDNRKIKKHPFKLYSQKPDFNSFVKFVEGQDRFAKMKNLDEKKFKEEVLEHLWSDVNKNYSLYDKMNQEAKKFNDKN